MRKFNVKQYFTQDFSSFRFNWPYFAFLGSDSEVLLYNAFYPEDILVVNANREYGITLKIFLTDKQDLYMLCYDQSQKVFKIYYIPLDACTMPNPDEPFYQYSKEKVYKKQAIDWHVRGSSDFKSSGINMETIIVVQHEDILVILG